MLDRKKTVAAVSAAVAVTEQRVPQPQRRTDADAGFPESAAISNV